MSVVRPFGAAMVLLTAVSASAAPPRPSAPARPAPAVAPAGAAKVIDFPAIHALVLPMKGSYLQHQEAFGRLSGYLARKGVAPSSDPFGRYYNDPAQGEENLVWEVGVAVPDGLGADPPFVVEDIPAGLMAVRVHRGSYEELAAARPALVEWARANGYRPSGPPLQIFQDFLSPQIELRLPVRKAR
jgi:DNA gyrase inhibitor GyrI